MARSKFLRHQLHLPPAGEISLLEKEAALLGRGFVLEDRTTFGGTFFGRATLSRWLLSLGIQARARLAQVSLNSDDHHNNRSDQANDDNLDMRADVGPV